MFFTNKAKKESLWTVPDEIKDAVELLEKQEEEDKTRAERQAQEETRNDVEAEQEREIERVRMEVQEVVKRKAEDISQSDETVISKKPRVEDQVGDEAEEADGLEDSEDSDVEDWQREAAAQLAKEAEEEKRRQEEEKAEEARKVKESAPQLTIPDRVDLSLDEGKALFKVCLQCDVSLGLTYCMYRPYSERKTSTRYIHGIRLFRFSSRTHAMCFFLPFLRVAKPSTSTVENVHANFERRVLRKRRRTPRKSSRSSLRLR